MATAIASGVFEGELNRELIESQQEYQDDSIKQMRNLVYATWGLVVVTLLVVALAQYK